MPADSNSPEDKKPKRAVKKNTPRLVSVTPPGKHDLAFLLKAAPVLLPFRFQTDRPLTASNTPISRQFAGVCLAVPANTTQADIVIGHLRDLGLISVRIDLSYDDQSPTIRHFLDGLRKEGMAVLLHLVPPFSEARQMPEPASIDRWKSFVEQIVHDSKDSIEGVEIGSTVNRARWTGCSLEGFLKAWSVAHDIIRRHPKLTLVGPNVTDFEPQYNAGLLGLLRSRQQLPDAHSSNMFAERTIEPEALDHKIGGRLFTRLINYNLIRKSRLIHAIGCHQGVNPTWSTCAFWTLPRIERVLVDSEEKMADYITRYYVLGAAIGAFERLYWGPLVSFREGLLDDGTATRDIPGTPDVVAFYPEFPGNPNQWRRRPAFDAMKTVGQWLHGALYLGPQIRHAGLEIHAFDRPDVTFHVAWTRNACLAAISDCYRTEDLTNLLQLISHKGAPIGNTPDFITESPIILVWKKGSAPSVRETASPLKQAKAASHGTANQYYLKRNNQGQAIVHAKNQAEADLLFERLDAAEIDRIAAESTMRKARNRVWTIPDPRNHDRLLVVKKPIRIPWHKRILDARKPNKALRSWNGTCELIRRGINTPRAIACIDSSDPLENWFVCEHFHGNQTARSYFVRYRAGDQNVEGVDFKTFISELIPFVRNMHERGVHFRDLSGGNVLVGKNPDGTLLFSLIDTARARFSNRRFPLSKRVADIKRLVHKLDPPRQAEFMRAYLSIEGKSFTTAMKCSFALYTLKTTLKRWKRKLF
jgi:hypothetical protein